MANLSLVPVHTIELVAIYIHTSGKRVPKSCESIHSNVSHDFTGSDRLYVKQRGRERKGGRGREGVSERKRDGGGGRVEGRAGGRERGRK